MLLWLQNRQVKQFRKQVGGNVCICSLNNRTALVHKHLKSLTRTVNNEIYNEQQPWLRQGLYSVKLPFLQYGSPSSRNTGSQPKWSVSRDASDGCCSHTAAWKVLRSCPATSQAISLARFSAVPNGWDLASSMDARRRWGPPWAQCMLLLDLKWKIAWLASFLHHQGKSWEQGSSWDEKDVLHLSKSPIYF